ncbi:glycosyltransferase family 2 protein [Atopobium minutum]|nr:glycosyltransferase [Atopobium minutum]
MYNVQAYLEQCLDSLLAQTFTDIEVICVNDGSPDNSYDIYPYR